MGANGPEDPGWSEGPGRPENSYQPEGPGRSEGLGSVRKVVSRSKFTEQMFTPYA